MAKLARRLVKTVNETLEHIYDKLDDHGVKLVEMRREVERLPLSPELDRLVGMLTGIKADLAAKRTLQVDLDRLEALFGGVKVSLERMGGNVLPGVVADIHALRDQMAEFLREMLSYRDALIRLEVWLDRLPVEADGVGSEVPQRSVQGRHRKKRKYTKKLKPEVEILSQGTAPHNGMDEEDPIKP